MANPFEKLVDETYQEIRSKLNIPFLRLGPGEAADEGVCLFQRKAPNGNQNPFSLLCFQLDLRGFSYVALQLSSW